jgi:hypothetical protein
MGKKNGADGGGLFAAYLAAMPESSKPAEDAGIGSFCVFHE